MKKIIVGIVLSLSIMPLVSSADTNEELRAQIQNLLAQIQQLQAKLANQTGSSSGGFCHTFTTDLGVGSSGDEVYALSLALQKEGNNLGKFDGFDEITASAVSSFQTKYKSEILTPAGLSSPSGYVGARTRAKLNALYGCGVTVPTPIPTIPPIQTPIKPAPVACTMEAKMCPDGKTYVGRTGPSCEFAACPSTNTSSTKPDLKIAAVFCEPSIPKINEKIFCSATVINNSSVNITKPFDVDIYGSSARVSDPLNAWERKTVKSSSGFSFPTVGTNVIRLRADIWNVIEESDENNNDVGFTINIEDALRPNIHFIEPASAKAGDTVTIYGSNLYGNGVVFDGINLTTYMTTYGYPNTSGNLMTFTVPTTATVGPHTIQVEQRIIGGLSNSKTLSVVSPTQTSNLTITTDSNLPKMKVGVGQTNYVLVTGADLVYGYKWSVVGSLPPGLSLIPHPYNPEEGIGISGTPTTAGTYNFSLQVTFGTKTATKQFTLVVDPKPAPIINLKTTTQKSTPDNGFVTASIAGSAQNKNVSYWTLKIECPNSGLIVTGKSGENICGQILRVNTSNMFSPEQDYVVLTSGVSNTSSNASYVLLVLSAYDSQNNLLGFDNETISLSGVTLANGTLSFSQNSFNFNYVQGEQYLLFRT